MAIDSTTREEIKAVRAAAVSSGASCRTHMEAAIAAIDAIPAVDLDRIPYSDAEKAELVALRASSETIRAAIDGQGF